MPLHARLARRVVALSLALTACGDHATSATDPSTPPPPPDRTFHADAARGHTAFLTACASCHASGDGFDLALFQFADSTTIRRALKHVDSLTAQDIAAYVRTLSVTPMPASTRLFQPGGAPLASDVDFARAAFGADAWPSTMTTAKLRAMDPRKVQVAVSLPQWAVETDDTDWMPDVALPTSVRADRDSAALIALAAYRAKPTDANLSAAAAAFYSAMERAGSNGPCHFEGGGGGRFDAEECFQTGRWVSSLVAQHMLRNGITTPMADSLLHDFWWDVGDAARRGFNLGVRASTGRQNWTSWMYLAWTFGPDHHPTNYFMTGLQAVGLSRHAAWAGLRSMVARPSGSPMPYDDLVNVERYSPTTWIYDAESFGMRHLLERLRAGDRPADLAGARTKVDLANREAGAKLTVTQRDALTALSQDVIAALR